MTWDRHATTGWSLNDKLAYYSRRAPNGCLLWIGAKDSKGYAVLTYKGRTQKASRLVWTHHSGPIPKGMLVCHDCPAGDNPACIEYNHLFIGTPKDNTQDMLIKGRNNPVRGEQSHNAKLTVELVLAIRAAIGTEEQIAAAFGVGQPTIHKIRTFKRWAHVLPAPTDAPIIRHSLINRSPEV